MLFHIKYFIDAVLHADLGMLQVLMLNTEDYSFFRGRNKTGQSIEQLFNIVAKAKSFFLFVSISGMFSQSILTRSISTMDSSLMHAVC